jgi:hypothetical protein
MFYITLKSGFTRKQETKKKFFTWVPVPFATSFTANSWKVESGSGLPFKGQRHQRQGKQKKAKKLHSSLFSIGSLKSKDAMKQFVPNFSGILQL